MTCVGINKIFIARFLTYGLTELVDKNVPNSVFCKVVANFYPIQYL